MLKLIESSFEKVDEELESSADEEILTPTEGVEPSYLLTWYTRHGWSYPYLVVLL